MFSEQSAKAGITYPKGFVASGVKAGIKKSGNLDVAVIYSKKEAVHFEKSVNGYTTDKNKMP